MDLDNEEYSDDVDGKQLTGEGPVGDGKRLIEEARTSKAKLAILIESQRSALVRLASLELDPRMRRRADADDVVQQVLMEATEGFPRFRVECMRSLRAWMYRIMRTTIQDLARKHMTSQKRSVGSETDAASAAAHQRLLEPAVVTPSPRTRLIAVENIERLESILCGLPESQRIAIELRYFDNLSVKEVSDRIDRSLTATAGLLKRGLSKLREIVEEDDIL